MTTDKFLMGSRALGVNNELSDYDYVCLDDSLSGLSYQTAIFNNHYKRGEHCYHIGYDYFEATINFDIEGEYCFLFNPLYFRVGLSNANPLDLRDKWVAKIKSLDLTSNYFWFHHKGVPRKRMYWVAFNVYCLKENTLYPSDEAMGIVRMFHDKESTPEDIDNLLNEIKNLSA